MKLNICKTRLWVVGITMGLCLPFMPVGAVEISVTSSEYRTPVVELYTSEGCSSCPPADSWFRKFGTLLNQDLHAVPLAFHVDYWNHLGWVDLFSKPEFTTRQREIAANNGMRTIYTPEFFVDGREVRGGPGILQAIRVANAQKATATISVEVVQQSTNRIHASIMVDNHAVSGQAYLVIYENDIHRKIEAGENRGKSLDHDFVVRHLSQPIEVQQGDNHADLTIDIPASWQRDNLGLAVVVFDPRSGETRQAVNTSLALLFPS